MVGEAPAPGVESLPVTDAPFLARLMAQTGFGKEDARHLAALLPTVEPEVKRLAERFYERILADEEASTTLSGSQARAERLKVTMIRWIRSGLSGPHDEDWLESRARIGRVHVQIEMPQHLMVTAMNGLRQDLREIVDDSLEGDSPRRRETSRALDRLLDLELAIMLDTYREDSESRLARHERLATIGELAASIAHDLRNPLGVIQSSLFLLQHKLEEEPGVTRHLEKIHRQVVRCNHIITDLLELVRGRAPSVVEVPATTFLHEVIDQAHVPEHVTLSLKVEDGTHLVCDPGLITQALHNLIDNACHAIGEEEVGTIEVSAHPHPEGCTLRVKDSGPGFSEGLLSTAFEPLVTGRSSGVGLGLAIVRGIAERHGGSTTAQNNPDRGATVEIFLPPNPLATEGGKP